MSLKSLLTQTAFRGETSFDEIRQLLRKRLKLNGRPQIVPYFGFGNEHGIQLRARVLEAREMSSIESDDSIWENVWRTYQRINSHEIPHAVVRAHFEGQSAEFTADEEGYVTITMPRSGPAQHGRETVQLELADSPTKSQTSAVVFTPNPGAAFGVISDIDDTILQSKATSYVQAAHLMFTKNHRTRLPFAGVAAFYRALQRGLGDASNPLFYVSSSPWNLFDMLTDFMEIQDIPHGPLFLKDYGITETTLISSGHGIHKTTQIDLLLATYPELPFVLLGDSGQKDPEIYAGVIDKHPDRIQAIYIRDVTSEQRDREVEALVKTTARHGTARHGVPLVFTATSLQAAEHAFSIGLIDGAAVDQIAKETSDNRPQTSE